MNLLRLAKPFAIVCAAQATLTLSTPEAGPQDATIDGTVVDARNLVLPPSTTPDAGLLGIDPLKPESAVNYSAGTAIQIDSLTATADYFRIEMSERLTLTRSYMTSPNRIPMLFARSFGEMGDPATFRFFVNDFATRTQGIETVVTWTPEALGGRTTYSSRFSRVYTTVTDPGEHLDRHVITSRSLSRPRTRWNVAAKHRTTRWSVGAKLNFYGQYWDGEDARALLGKKDSYLFPPYPGKALLDLQVSFPMNGITLSVGAKNVLNTYPKENPGARSGTGNVYGRYSPFGFNGGYYYIQTAYSWSVESSDKSQVNK